METIKSYMPEGTLNFNSEHGILYTFRFGDATAQLYTKVRAEVSGYAALDTGFFDIDVCAAKDHELTKKHAVLEHNEWNNESGSVKEVIFYDADNNQIVLPVKEAIDHLVSVQIVNYFPEGE
ncbi:hypothetical protein CPT_Mater76 [Bacillus phage Mater]|uniref:Uncharacterized protein n=1 Tax=Bacillus phage Mater TaxID=1540090 RepID=A0A0A0RUJ2_9CAUD|nr:hypothetical protein CPT_Mater76 [Bacillus phage Mater]AIW03233.1 hypothetical protein CPT_Mater76 [Bacillus phage Mater]